jgi:hypothetical protein
MALLPARKAQPSRPRPVLLQKKGVKTLDTTGNWSIASTLGPSLLVRQQSCVAHLAVRRERHAALYLRH